MRTSDFSPAARVPVAQILADLGLIARSSPAEARLMPPGAFHSEDFLRLELEKLFASEWICVGRLDDFETTGSYTASSVADVPVLVVKQTSGELKAFVNACAHRRARLVPESRGRKAKFVCPYHAWTYAPSGELVGAPFMASCPGFEKSDIRLTSLKLETWEGFVFVSLDSKPALTPRERLRQFTDEIVGRYRMERFVTVIRDELDYAGNWKNIIENFTESYHVFAAHRNTFAVTEKTPDDYLCGENLDWCSYHLGTQKAESGQGAAHPRDQTLTGAWRRRLVIACVFPGLLISLTPDLLWYVSVQPNGVDRFRASWAAAVPQEYLDDLSEEERPLWIGKLRAFMDTANEEDRPLIEALFRGTASTRAPRGMLHPIEKNVWDFARYLDRKFGEDSRAALAAE